MENKRIEVEKQVFLTDEQYNSLLIKFEVQSTQPERQITTYYSTKGKDRKAIDWRLMRTLKYTKLWMKPGIMHDTCHDEYEVFMSPEYIDPMKKMLESTFNIKTKWFRERIETEYKEAIICIDKSINYDKIFEIELHVSSDEEKEEGKKLLDVYLKELGFTETPKKIRNKKYKNYFSNWRNLKFPDDEIKWLQNGSD